MRSVVITALVICLGIVFLFYRRRLKLAFFVAGGLYATLITGRFILLREDADRFVEVGLVLGVLGLVWLVTNVSTRLLERRRARRTRL